MAAAPLFSVEQLVIYIDNLDKELYCLAGRIVEVRVPENSQQEITYLVKSCGESESNTNAKGFAYTEFRESQLYSVELIQREVAQFLKLEGQD